MEPEMPAQLSEALWLSRASVLGASVLSRALSLYVDERRTHRDRRACSRSAARHHVSCRAGQQTPRARHDLRKDAEALRPPHRRGSREDGDVPLRPDEGPHHLAIAVAAGPPARASQGWGGSFPLPNGPNGMGFTSPTQVCILEVRPLHEPSPVRGGWPCFGVREQSAVATPLWLTQPSIGHRPLV